MLDLYYWTFFFFGGLSAYAAFHGW